MSEESDRMRVLVVTRSLDLGGAERLIATSAPWWNATEFEYHVLYLDPKLDHLVPSIEPFAASVRPGRGIGLRGLLEYRRQVARLQPDIVHAHLPMAGVLTRLVVWASPIVYTEHGGYYRPITQFLNWVTYGRNNSVIAVSAEVGNSVRHYSGPVPIVIPNGTSVPVEMPKRNPASDYGERHLLVHIGHVRPGKGHRALMDMFERVRAERPDINLVSIGAGQDAELVQEIRQYEASSGGAFRYLGFRDDVGSFLLAADALVITSDMEGLPIALLEAWATGTPVVTTAAGGIQEVLRHGENGLMVSVGDSDGLARAVIDLIDKPALRRRLAIGGFRTVESKFDIADNVRAVEALYRSVHSAQLARPA